MEAEEIKEGDIVEIDYIAEFTKEHINEGRALVIWKGFNRQPLVRKLDTKTTIWTCYEYIAKVVGHIDIEDYMDKALEPCEDAISRQAVLAMSDFVGERPTYSNPFAKLEEVVRVEDIMALPSVTLQPKIRQWIPVSEKLPKENGWYQCTVILSDLSLTMDLFYKNGKWLDNRRINMFNTYDIYGYGNSKEKHKLSYQELISEFDWTENVIAWKPLSKPCKVEKEE